MDIVKEIKATDIQGAISQIVKEIAERHRDTENLFTAGIADGGLELCSIINDQLSAELKREVGKGVVNIAFQRDDIGTRPIPKVSEHTNLPFDVEDATIILIDDVLFTGRSVRAALNEVFDQGRPACIELAVLFDRGCQRLPIKADYNGFSENTDPNQKVKVTISSESENENLIQILEA